MIGSPDLLAFTSTEGFGETEKDRQDLSLPEDLSVPLAPPGHPWTTSAQFCRDFILVAEFSEQVGPKPVLTIPDDPRVIGTFDLNHFSVRLMSVDYQASGPVNTTHTSAGPRLNFSEDSKVILGDSADDAFAYVQHLTLYDLQARGMVRPFCMAYVCSDQAKLMENFLELSTCFSQASDSLKTGNRQAFSLELQRKLQELEYTRLTLQETEGLTAVNGLTDVREKDRDLEAVECSILNHRDLLRQVTSYPNRKLKQPDFLPYDPADSLTDPAVLLPPELSLSTPIRTSTSTSHRSEYRLKPLEELCNAYFLSLMKEQLAETERRFRGDRSVLRIAHVSSSLSRKLRLTNFLFELWSPEEEEDEEKESAEAELQSPTRSKGGVEMFPLEPMSLESFCSCVEEIPIKLEAAEAGTVTPECSVAMEMTGSVSSGDSIEVLGTEKSYQTQHVGAGSDSKDLLSPAETPLMLMDTSIRRTAADAGLKNVRIYARRANSEDSIEVLSTTESIFPDDLTAITEEDAEQQSQSNYFENEQETTMDCKCDDALKEEKIQNVDTPENKNELHVQKDDKPSEPTSGNGSVPIKEEPTAESLKKNEVLKDNSPKTTPKLQDKESMELTVKLSEVPHAVPSVPELHVNLVPPAALVEADRWCPPSAPLRLLSVDEVSDCASFTGSDSPSPTQNSKSHACAKRRRRRKAGLRALRFLRQNSFSQHAVFCLLSGRPLVIIGGDMSLVRKMVDALSLFLPAPGPDGNAVMACLSTPLQLTDLLTWRLIGIHRSPSSSSIIHSLMRYSRYLAQLDLDQRTLRCPSYSGSLVGRLANPHTGISRGITYLLHLESSLTALANQALICTFNRTAGGKDDAERAGFPFARGFCSSESDFRVMSFLSDLIKRRHAGCGPPVLRFSYSSVLLHRNTQPT